MEEMTLYQQDLIESLKDPHEAAAYLNAAFEDGDHDIILLALQNVAKARGVKMRVPRIPSLFSPLSNNELSRPQNTPPSPSFLEHPGQYPSNGSDLPNLKSLLQSMGLLLRVEPEQNHSIGK